MRRIREDLVAHVGGKPTVVQRMLIDRATVLSLRLALLDEKITSEISLTEHDNNYVIAWQNALTRCLVALGVKTAAAQRPPTLADLFPGQAA
jgi:hypothetical protein